MVSKISRWASVLALPISGYLWLGISTVVGGVVGEWVKSDIALKSYGSVSAMNLVIALIWPVVVGIWVRATTLVSTKSLALGVCAVAAWTVVLTVLIAIGVDLLWNFRWALAAIPIVAWVLEIAVALWLLRITTPPLSWGSGLQGVLTRAVVALAWLVEAKAMLLALSPGVAIRI